MQRTAAEYGANAIILLSSDSKEYKSFILNQYGAIGISTNYRTLIAKAVFIGK